MDLEIEEGSLAQLPLGSRYEEVFNLCKNLCTGEDDLIANLANTTALLKDAFGWWWVGFYLVKGDELVLGPFQGPVACTRIAKGKGVCGSAWSSKSTVVVDNVHEFPGHIACSAQTNSEIVLPIFKDNEVVAVLDLDSAAFAAFSDIDQNGLQKIADFLGRLF